jgi:MFS family permease
MELSLLRQPAVAIVMAISVFATMALALPQLLIPYMFETPTANSLRNQILAGAAAKGHVSVSLLKDAASFQGNINYAGGFSVFQVATHVTLVLSVVAMIIGPIGGLLARRYGARLPLIISGVAMLVAFELWTPWHGAWKDQLLIGIFWGIGTACFYAGGPNVLIDAIPATRQGISSAMYAAFGSFGSALAVALPTAILAAHPFKFVIQESATKQIVTVIPQVYTNNGFTESYLLIGVSAGLILIILAVALKAGRTPARGGIVDSSLLGDAMVAEVDADEATVFGVAANTATPPPATANGAAPEAPATSSEARAGEGATQPIPTQDSAPAQESTPTET